MKTATAILLLGTLLASTAGAQVFKCPDPATGRLTYSDAPCTGGRLLERQRTRSELEQERWQADAAGQRTREQDQRILSSIQSAAPQAVQSHGGSPPDRGSSHECKLANREIEVAASSVTGSQRDRDIRTEAARRKANIACFAPAQAASIEAAAAAAPKPVSPKVIIIQQSDGPRARNCTNEGGGRMRCF